MKAVFLGTNGWFDTDTGHTVSCFVETAEEYIIFDAGFGLADFNKHADGSKPAHLFISHLHLDHICGLHLLETLNLQQGITIYYPKKMKKYLDLFYRHPFTASPKELVLKIKLVALEEGRHDAPCKFTCRQLKHIDSTFGYRMEIEGKIISYCSDTAICRNDLLLAKNADLLIHESSFVEKKKKNIWGHSSPEEAAELAKKAGARKLVLTHFAANSFINMGMRQAAENKAKTIFADTVAAKDGLEMAV
jgi:ribonuclease BN (tRNA processing enzyme)